MEVSATGLDLGTDVFQVHRIIADGTVVFNRSIRRRQLLKFLEALPSCLVGIEAVHDRLCNGRPYKMLTVLEEYTREAPRVAVKPKMNSADVLDALCLLLLQCGKPECIRSDNGSEFIATTLQDWLRRVGIKPIQIYPGSPCENG